MGNELNENNTRNESQTDVAAKAGWFKIAQTFFDKVKEGSLLDLFESPHMTIHMII